MLFQSGGCCEGSSPLCLHEGELLVGPNDLLLGEVGGVAFYIDAEQYRRWNRPSFELDLAAGGSGSFSLEGRTAIHFVTRSSFCERADSTAGTTPEPARATERRSAVSRSSFGRTRGAAATIKGDDPREEA